MSNEKKSLTSSEQKDIIKLTRIRKNMDEIMQDILNLSRKKMRESGEYGREAFHQYIEESIEYYIEKGRIDENENTDLIEEELMELYNQTESREADV
jgi:predicted DNA-binding protein